MFWYVVHFEKNFMFSIMVVILFYSILTLVAKSLFMNNFKDREMITSCLMFERTTLKRHAKKVGPWNEDLWSGTDTLYPGPRTGPGTWNLGPIGKNWDPGSWTLYVETYYIETSPLVCLDWFFYDGDLRYERVN